MNATPISLREDECVPQAATARSLDELIALRAKIAGLEAVKCRMTHERVRHDPLTGAPVPECLPELGYQRIGFCPKAERDKRIACGHTMARYILEEGVGALPEAERAPLAVELRDVTNEIHALDHQKGDAEKLLAQLTAQGVARASDRAAAQAAAHAIDERHSACVDRIAQVRHEVLARLDASIERQNAQL